jgi:hypothetical protein
VDQSKSGEGIRFVEIGDVAPKEFVAQMHGDQRVGVHLRVLEWSPERFVAYTRYDPGMMLPRHSHKSDSIVYILEGEVRVGDRLCKPGTLIVLDKSAYIGPLVAGPEGCVFLESYAGDVMIEHEDLEPHHELLAERGVVEVAPTGLP